MQQIWQSIPTLGQQIIIAVIAGAILYILAFPVRKLITSSQEQERKREEKLRIHFDELYKEMKASLSDVNINVMYGLIVTYAGGVPQYHPDVVGIELPKLPDSFEAHFPKETKMYGNHTDRILTNNKDYKELRQKIKTDFESEGIPLVSINPPPTTSPVVYDTIFWPLFSWWNDRSEGKTKASPNFEQIETTADFGPNHLVVSGWHSGAIAYAVGPTDKQRCKEIISRIAYKAEYENEAAKIIHLANKTLKEFRTFRGQLTQTLEDIKKLWPGTHIYKFKREKKKCTRCKQIFG